ncbi:MAG TPA: NADPH-dependent FMN reductase [Dyella sp.]|uniref:NADPH-dependent FMN reductase n=1 Tax=Dyella sp. TaxID=1869338 RepID=UPI002F95C11C
MSDRPWRVLALCGSLRRVSSNRAFLEAARELAPPELVIAVHQGLGDLPLFNPDDEAEPLPLAAQVLRDAVGASDALLIACPEYAHGIPGPFKNLLDWLVGSLEFPGKPVLQVNTSGRDSHHAQTALREVLATMSARLLTDVPLNVPLPGAGCDVAYVLADGGRRRSVETVLAALTEALATAAGG